MTSPVALYLPTFLYALNCDLKDDILNLLFLHAVELAEHLPLPNAHPGDFGHYGRHLSPLVLAAIHMPVRVLPKEDTDKEYHLKVVFVWDH